MPLLQIQRMPESDIVRRCVIAVGVLCVAGNAVARDDLWQRQIIFGDRVATASISGSGYRLTAAGVVRKIPRQAASTKTASPLFDALFALAQQELAQARVRQITDGAFNNGKPLPCDCLETGKKWKYVWTRDLAYATDLALFRFDPRRARNGLEFKLSGARAAALPDDHATYVVQDTGSGGSWPVSTDRIVWFLGAGHLLDDKRFADKVYNALTATLAQDRRYVFDAGLGLYRGETSFLDWREQSYPAWTARDVAFIAESFALSTNVLYYQALRQAEEIAETRHDPLTSQYRQQADALKSAIDAHFWREDRGLYMSYIGGAGLPQIEAYDLLGTSLAIVSGVAPPARARRALASYPTWDAGSPVIWPEHRDAPIYHNRAIWPFVSAYALRAARALDEPTRIAHELRSIMRGAAMAGSNMEDFEFTTQAVHVEDGERSGPVVNSPRQLWSVAAYLDMVVEGVFGLTDHDNPQPKIPRELVPMLFGERDEIQLSLRGRHITLVKPRHLADGDNLLISANTSDTHAHARVQLRGVHVEASALPLDRPQFAPATPSAARVERDGTKWRIHADSVTEVRLDVNGKPANSFRGETAVPYRPELQCFTLVARAADGIESLPSKPVCVGDTTTLAGEGPYQWTAPTSGRYQARLNYRNSHGPINTGVSAAMKTLLVQCVGAEQQRGNLVMPHSDGMQQSTAVTFAADAGQRCDFSLEEGFNMSFLQHYAFYTGGQGGATGAVNSADASELQLVLLQ